ncbi:short-chain dehydrogenase [Rathayibacter tritici]|uniref:SDR family NAD(P)-dependent oxidoreductase n=1 Tax=Rathayibacter tritici TaxID=33888 RepID=UPI000CE91770|nr:SDR family NAD(P)-dependent oxidoreductase [Rathayibacter tritici]PPF67094.1 short-chain dehydrogenase [Rathayibacter tritici]PPG06755.1 short-chain dehydrogenase [Rathayibacter tritici]
MTDSSDIAIVTGAGSAEGIGAATALLLGRAGMRVVVTSTTERIQERVADLRRAGVDAHGVAADLTGQLGVDAVLNAARRAFGEPTVLVNNAGMTSVSTADSPAAIDDITIDQWAMSLERNLTTALRMTRAVVPAMRAAGYGRVVNVSSLSGAVMAYSGDVAYHAAKAGMLGLTRGAAVDVAAAGITVNAVAPGWIATSSSSEHEIAMGAATPVGRSGTPVEVAAAVAFLAGRSASYITGQLLIVDGANSINEERGAAAE